MTNNTKNPWAGLASYEDPTKSERKQKFCGRDNEIYDVTRLIDDNLLLILYGKSGIGKTSLLNAGVFPKLRSEQYLPVSIRLGTLEEDVAYQDIIIAAIDKALEEIKGNKTIFNVVEEQPDNQSPDWLWNYFARHRFSSAEKQPLFPVVILDQFEEVLRNSSPEHIGKAQKLLNQIQYLIDESHALNDCRVDGKEYYYDFNFRFVISIREDELYLLEDNIDDLSLGMFRNCRYRLRSLSKQGATEAILVPGKDCIADEEKQAVVDRVIELSKRPQSNDIDTLLLSLVCAGTYDKKAREKIALSDLSIWKDNPMEEYYKESVKGLTADQVRYIQQHLIREDGSRKQVAANEVKTALGESTYHQLTQGKNKLLTIGDKGKVELLHDQLGLAIYEERKAFEERERKKKSRRRISVIGIIVLAIAGIFWYQNAKLKQQRWKMLESQSKLVAEKAISLAPEDSYLARILALEILPKDLDKPDRPYTLEAERALRMACKHNTAILRGHTACVESAFYSPDSKLIASISFDSTLKIWDAQIGKELWTIKKQNDMFLSANFSPDGKQVITGSHDSTLTIWDVKNGRESWVYKEDYPYIFNAKFSPDGKSIMFSSNGNKILNLESHEIELDLMDYILANFSPDGKQIVGIPQENRKMTFFCRDLSCFPDSLLSNQTFYILNANNGEKMVEFEGLDYLVNSAVFSPDGKQIVTASSGKALKIWDAKTGKELKNISENLPSLISASFSPDGKKIIFNSYDNDEFWVWDTEKEEMQTFVSHNFGIQSASFSPNGQHIVSAYNDNTIRIWEMQSNDDSRELFKDTTITDTTFFRAITMDSDGKYLAYVIDGILKLVNLDANADYQVYMGNDNNILDIAFSPDGEHLISSDQKTIKIWDIKLKETTLTITGAGVANRIAFSPDGKKIVTESFKDDKGMIILWDAETGEELCSRQYDGSTVVSIRFNPNGQQIVVGTLGNSIIVDAETLETLYTLSGHAHSVNYTSFSPDGQYIISVSHDKTARIWDSKSRKCLNVLEGHTSGVNHASFSPNGKLVASSSYDGTIRIWDVATGYCLQVLETASVIFVEFLPDGEHLISISYDGTICKWDFPPLQELIDQTRERFKNRPLTPEERKMYYLE